MSKDQHKAGHQQAKATVHTTKEVIKPHEIGGGGENPVASAEAKPGGTSPAESAAQVKADDKPQVLTDPERAGRRRRTRRAGADQRR